MLFPKVSSYIYLGIPSSDDLLLEHIISHMHFKVRKSLLSFTHFFSNKLIPIAYKKKKFFNPLLFSKVIYYSPLLGSNKSRTARIQTLINTGLFWCIGSFSKNGKNKIQKTNDYILDIILHCEYLCFISRSKHPSYCWYLRSLTD